MRDWVALRQQGAGGDVISGEAGSDRLAGGAGQDSLGAARTMPRPSQIGAAQRSDVDGAIAAGRVIGGAAKAGWRRVTGQGPEQPRASDPVARWAESRVGQGGYGLFDGGREVRGPANNLLPPELRGHLADPKCNQFVWDALEAGGAPAGRVDGGRIPVARDWGDTKSKIAGYAPVAGSPQPGDVVSNGHHVGIHAPLPGGRPGTVSAATPSLTGDGGWDGGVVHNDWGFRGDEGRIVVWRPISGRR